MFHWTVTCRNIVLETCWSLLRGILLSGRRRFPIYTKVPKDYWIVLSRSGPIVVPSVVSKIKLSTFYNTYVIIKWIVKYLMSTDERGEETTTQTRNSKFIKEVSPFIRLRSKFIFSSLSLGFLGFIFSCSVLSTYGFEPLCAKSRRSTTEFYSV